MLIFLTNHPNCLSRLTSIKEDSKQQIPLIPKISEIQVQTKIPLFPKKEDVPKSTFFRLVESILALKYSLTLNFKIPN